MAQPGTISRIVLAIVWLLLGLVMIGVPVWLGWTRWQAILNGHPAMLVATIACGMIGFVAGAWSIATLALGARQDREGDPRHPAHRTAQQIGHRAILRVALAVPALLVCAAVVAGVLWARPYQATAPATAAMYSGEDVLVTDLVGWYEMQGQRKDKDGRLIKPTTGLIFIPGSRIDPRAYAALLRPLAAAGYFVAVLKAPFGVASTVPNQPQEVLDVHPNIKYWAVGGHSLGGATAAAFADSHQPVMALVLYAAYPTERIVRTDLKVLSISGSSDGLATPARIEAAKPDLPLSTLYLVIEGGVHSTFGDYGEQPGDGTPAVDPTAAHAEIEKATADLLASLTPPPAKPKK
jgi:Alpha/beta hydrolase family